MHRIFLPAILASVLFGLHADGLGTPQDRVASYLKANYFAADREPTLCGPDASDCQPGAVMIRTVKPLRAIGALLAIGDCSLTGTCQYWLFGNVNDYSEPLIESQGFDLEASRLASGNFRVTVREKIDVREQFRIVYESRADRRFRAVRCYDIVYDQSPKGREQPIPCSRVLDR